MKRLIAALFALTTISVGIGMGANYQATQGSGTTFGSLVVSAINYAQQLVCDPTTPAQCMAINASGQITEANSAAQLTALQSAQPAGTNRIGYTSDDPCTQLTKSGAPFSLTASGQVITGTSSKKTYICSIDLISATAQNIALVEGTGSTCATNIFGLAGGTTAATGWNLAANGGLTKGSGNGTVYIGSGDANVLAANVCLLLSSTGQTSGHITYVQAP